MNIQTDRKNAIDMNELELAEFRYSWRKAEYNRRFQSALNTACQKGYKTSEACAYALGSTDKFAQHINLDLFSDLYLSEKRKLDSKY